MYRKRMHAVGAKNKGLPQSALFFLNYNSYLTKVGPNRSKLTVINVSFSGLI